MPASQERIPFFSFGWPQGLGNRYPNPYTAASNVIAFDAVYMEKTGGFFFMWGD